MLKIISPHPVKNIKAQLQEIEEKDGGLYVLETAFYIIKLDSNADFRKKLSAGIIKDVSIQFRAYSREAVLDNSEDKNVKYYEYIGPGEALEGSLVWLGSQYGMQNRKALVPNTGDPDETPEGEQQTGEQIMKATFKSLEIEGMEFSEDGIVNLQEVVDQKVSTILEERQAVIDERDTLKTANEEAVSQVVVLNEIKAVLGEEPTKEAVEKLKQAFDSRKEEIAGEVVAMMVQAKAIENDPEKVTAKKDELKALELSALEGKRDEYRNITKTVGTAGSQLPSGEGDKKKVFVVDVKNVR